MRGSIFVGVFFNLLQVCRYGWSKDSLRRYENDFYFLSISKMKVSMKFIRCY